MKTYLYLLCYRTEALVASHLDPEAFGAYMAVGTHRRTAGNVMFIEIDPTLRSEYLDLPAGLGTCQPNADGSPVSSRYLSIYRVLEHIPVDALGRLYLVTRDGRVLGLEGRAYGGAEEEAGDHMYVELCPLTPRVVSRLGPAAFCQAMTSGEHRISVPRLLFADCLIDREPDGSLAGHLPYRDPAHIIDCLNELESSGRRKISKTVDRSPPLVAFYRTIRRGFFVGDRQGMLRVYPYPTRAELEDRHWLWWRSASIS
ncbi:MAG: hypothetical protein JJU36_16490 [Phycisphaeraceae bacterium]|nr:hypothetical protein [Phycisphaeraceae bacterium]